MASDRPPDNTGNQIKERTARPREPNSSSGDDMRLLMKTKDHLNDSLDVKEPVTKNYHIRLALQALQIAGGERFD